MADKDTQVANGVDVLARLIDNVQKSVDRGHQEMGERLGKIETSIGDLKNVDGTLANGVAEISKGLEDVKARVKALEDNRNDQLRQRSEDRDERKQERDALIVHVGKLEESIISVRSQAEGTQSEIVKTNEAVGAIVDELGLEAHVALGRQVKPHEPQPTPTLQKIEKRAKSSTIVQAVIALGVIVEALLRIFH